MSKTAIIAKFAIGAESVDDGIGELIVQQVSDNAFEVFVNAGSLPNGEESRLFDEAEAAVAYAVNIVNENWRELLDY